MTNIQGNNRTIIANTVLVFQSQTLANLDTTPINNNIALIKNKWIKKAKNYTDIEEILDRIIARCTKQIAPFELINKDNVPFIKFKLDFRRLHEVLFFVIIASSHKGLDGIYLTKDLTWAQASIETKVAWLCYLRRPTDDEVKKWNQSTDEKQLTSLHSFYREIFNETISPIKLNEVKVYPGLSGDSEEALLKPAGEETKNDCVISFFYASEQDKAMRSYISIVKITQLRPSKWLSFKTRYLYGDMTILLDSGKYKDKNRSNEYVAVIKKIGNFEN